MAAPTVEELRRQIDAENAAHKAALDSIAQQTRGFQAVLAEQQQAFSDLITRVTDLRVKKGEYLAAQASGRTESVSFNTGSALLDSFLYALQAKLDGPGLSVGSSVLQSLETAALEAMTPFGHGRVSALFTSNATAVRNTGIMLLFPNDVRGVRPWAKKHFPSCPSCTAKLARLPAWTPHRYDSKSVGFAAAPNLRSIPHKHYHHVSCSLVQERSMADRMDTEQLLDLVRGTFFLHLQSAAQPGQAIANAPDVCAYLTQSLQAFVQEAMEELRGAARTSAPWNDGAKANADLSAAIEILLHMVQPRVQVTHVAQPALAKKDNTPCSLVQVDLAVSVPLQVSALAPLLQVMKDAAQRQYLIEHVLTPLAQRVGDALGAGQLASHYTAVGLQFAEALYRIAVNQGLVSATSPADGPSAKKAAVPSPTGTKAPSSTSSGSATLAQLYYILQALAVFGTTVEVEVAAPEGSTSSLSTSSSSPTSAASKAQQAKAAALRLARSLLQHFSPPAPLTVPPPDDPAATDLIVKVARAPTTFLEILNRTFSSNQRLPSTSRSSALDTFITPKSKISLGLKLFRELVVDVYRPYHPCTGVVLASENGANGRPRAAPCVPVIDLPVDWITANVKVAAYAAQRLQDLSALEASLATQEPSTVEVAGKQALEKVADVLEHAAAVERLRGQWAAIQVQVVGAPKVCVDVVLPFSMTEVDIRAATKPLLCFRTVYDC